MATIGNVTFACDDPSSLAAFWAEVLDYDLEELPPEIEDALIAEGHDMNAAAAIVDPSGEGPRLFFNKAAKTPTESIPIHLDINVDDREAAVARFTDLGATLIKTKTRQLGPLSETWTVMEDPEGNGFCVQAPH